MREQDGGRGTHSMLGLSEPSSLSSTFIHTWLISVWWSSIPGRDFNDKESDKGHGTFHTMKEDGKTHPSRTCMATLTHSVGSGATEV